MRPLGPKRLLSVALVALAGLATAAPVAAAPMVVHLPSTPVENAARRAGAIDRLAVAITDGVPGLTVEPKIFRRFADARAFLDDNPDTVLVLSDAAWVTALATTFEPSHRFVIDGGTTYRRILVARNDASSLSDLRQRQLVVVESAGAGDGDFLTHQIFGGEIDPAIWFGSVRFLPDDSAAVTEVLYGDADGGLVADFNPLLAEHLGQELTTVFSSQPLSSPILSVHREHLDAAQRTALDSVLVSAVGQDKLIVAGLGIDGFAPVPRAERSAITSLPDSRGKRFETLAPRRYLLPPLPPPPLELLPLALELELPPPPSVAGDLLDAESGSAPRPD